MVKVKPCQPTIGKVQLILDDVFKLSRALGTFPIDSEYSRVSKYYIAKGTVLYFLASVIAIVSSYCITHEDVSLSTKVAEILKIAPIIIMHWINLTCLVVNRRLVKGLYDELKDIEYQFWYRDADWFYKPSWSNRYLSCTAVMIFGILWEISYNKFDNILFRIPNHVTYATLFSITSQYLALLQVCLSLLRQVKTVEESGTVVKLTDKLLTLCQNVNSLYEPQLLLYITNLFIIILVIVYKGIIENMTLSIDKVIWKMVLIYPLLMITLNVGYISKEEMLYFHLVAKRDIVFTSCGFFKLEVTLICSMITTGMDYLVFLITYV